MFKIVSRTAPAVFHRVRGRPLGVVIPSGTYDSFTDVANGQPTFDPI
jgi:hypothetical protein